MPVIGLRTVMEPGNPITNRQKFMALSSLVKALSLKVTGLKCPQTSDDSLFAPGRIQGWNTEAIGAIIFREFRVSPLLSVGLHIIVYNLQSIIIGSPSAYRDRPQIQ